MLNAVSTQELLCSSNGFLDRHGRNALGHSDAKFRKKILGLILVNIHRLRESLLELQGLKHSKAAMGSP